MTTTPIEGLVPTHRSAVFSTCGVSFKSHSVVVDRDRQASVEAGRAEAGRLARECDHSVGSVAL
jgi:hypothetical protein